MYKQPIPILRGESLENLKQSIVRLLDRNRVGYPYKTCLNCLHWNEGAELCKLANARPPADIIVFSCPSHEDNDDIPF
jgi:hypothetical protein